MRVCFHLDNFSTAKLICRPHAKRISCVWFQVINVNLSLQDKKQILAKYFTRYKNKISAHGIWWNVVGYNGLPFLGILALGRLEAILGSEVNYWIAAGAADLPQYIGQDCRGFHPNVLQRFRRCCN